MTRPRRTAAQTTVNYAEAQDSDDEEEEIETRESRSKDEDFKVATEGSDEGDEAEYIEDDQEEFVPRKKARSSVTKDKQKSKVNGKGKGRARAGKLQLMVDLPVDIWFMIAEYLDPPSLLYLGRANKMMRSLFASKSKSQGLWNVVKRSVQLPELEATDLHDFTLTRLLYERECHLCGKRRAPIVDYHLRKRYCSSCRSDDLFAENRLRKLIPDFRPDASVCSLYTDRGYYSVIDTTEMNEKILVLESAIERAKGKKQKEEAYDALREFVKSREAIVEAAFRDGEKLAEWERSSADERRVAAIAARTARANAIEANLLELGYEKRDIEEAGNNRSIRDLIRQPTALTAKIWNKIEAKMIEGVEFSKQNRLDEEAQARLGKIKPYYESLRKASEENPFPDFNIFATLPAVRPLWKEEDSTVDDHSWQNALDEINAQIPQARRRIQLGFARELLEAYDAVNHSFPEEFRLSVHPHQTDLFSYDSSPSYRKRLHATISIEDPSTISDQDLNTLLSRFTARFSKHDSPSTPLSWTEVYARNSYYLLDGSESIVCRHWLRTQLNILRQTGLEDSEETEKKLKMLGNRFNCINCHEHLKFFFGKPQSNFLNWKEMVEHAFEYHPKQYYSSDSRVGIIYKAATPNESRDKK
ncbi:hypothetical protein JCM3765_007824 [Sporobolomyces pararoseus]